MVTCLGNWLRKAKSFIKVWHCSSHPKAEKNQLMFLKTRYYKRLGSTFSSMEVLWKRLYRLRSAYSALDAPLAPFKRLGSVFTASEAPIAPWMRL
jgi:hypothetical protein